MTDVSLILKRYSYFELQDYWSFPDRRKVTKRDVMLALSSVDSILLRATYSTTTYKARYGGKRLHKNNQERIYNDGIIEIIMHNYE